MQSTEMQYRTLGNTGERVSAIGLGGWHIGMPNVPEELAIRIVRPDMLADFLCRLLRVAERGDCLCV